MSFDLNTTPDSFATVFPQTMVDVLLRFQLPYDLNSQAIDEKPITVYIYDLVAQCNIYCSRPLEKLLGYAAAEITSIDGMGFANLIHPDDLERVAAHYQRFTTLSGNETIAIQYRMRRADGTWCWLYSQETPLVLAVDGFPLQVVGLIQDITNWPSKAPCDLSFYPGQLTRPLIHSVMMPQINLAPSAN